MAFTEPERVKIRRYMGWPPGNTEPNYDALILDIQSVADGGSMPTADTEAEARALLTALASLETKMTELHSEMIAHKVDEMTVDPYRAMIALRSEGRRLVRNLGTLLDATPLIDAFIGSVG